MSQTTKAVYQVAAGKKRVPNPQKYPRPGAEEYGKPLGDRGDHSSEEVLSYLDSLKPAKG